MSGWPKVNMLTALESIQNSHPVFICHNRDKKTTPSCHFCGGTGIELIYENDDDYYVWCDNCRDTEAESRQHPAPTSKQLRETATVLAGFKAAEILK